MVQNSWFKLLLRNSYFSYLRNDSISPIRKGYSKDRLQLHNEIIRKITNPCMIKQKKIQPIAILLGGGTAAGKTLLRKTLIMKRIEVSNIDCCVVDADEIKLHIPEYIEFLNTEPSKAASLVHKESTDIRNKAIEKLINNKCSFIYEGTMAKKASYQSLVKSLKAKHYWIEIWIADIPLELALKRAKKRENETGRKVHYHVIKNTHQSVTKTFHTIRKEVDEYFIFDNQKGFELIYSKDFINKKQYSAFCSKAR